MEKNIKLKKRLFKIFQSFNLKYERNFFQLFSFYKNLYLFYDHNQKDELNHESKVY